MKRSAMYGWLLLLVALLATATITPSKRVQAQGSAPVTVVNTPLPVSLSGVGNVSGTVKVASLPAVSLVEGTHALVSDVDNPARNAYAVKLCAFDDNGGLTYCADPSSATVPSGTRYVIEQVAGGCLVDSGDIQGLELTAHLNGKDHTYGFRDRLSDDTVGDARAFGYFFQETRIYADGGVQNGLSVQISGGGYLADCEVTLSGYLAKTTPVFPTQP